VVFSGILNRRACVLGLVRPLGDLFAFALSTGETVGRWGCYFAGCCYGKPAHISRAIWQHDAWRHPTQIYSSVAAAITFATLVVLERRSTLPENGLFYLQGAMFCTFRFVIEFFRVGDVAFAGLTAAQLGCMAGLCFFGYKLMTMRNQTQAVTER
jgi:phosphatidylglycerol:prolipoprotein diacylglycerol transferase